MKVGFLNNQIDNRGTGNALFDYAHYNEEILGNESVILSLDYQYRNQLMEERLIKRFGMIYSHNYPYTPQGIDVVYHIKSGEDDGFRVTGTRYAVHAVFSIHPHGDRYAAVSPWLGNRHNVPFVPHIISLPETTDDLRLRLEIRQTDIVFGRHGGPDTFDIPFVWSAINRALKAKDNVWFLFLNTDQPKLDFDFYDPKRVVFMDETSDPYEKRIFINTCDAMLHARRRGETFGMAIGEFASVGIPILTYGLSPERNHLEEVACYTYDDEDELLGLLTLLDFAYETPQHGYVQYTPENVMKKFQEVFLD